jgi:hypothetical protein
VLSLHITAKLKVRVASSLRGVVVLFLMFEAVALNLGNSMIMGLKHGW